MTTRFANLVLAAVAGTTVLAGCGGGTEGTGGVPPPSQSITSTGTMTKGSVVLNGVRFDDSAAIVTDDRNRGAAQLANGMVIKLRGRSDDRATGAADRIDVENEGRGVIQSIDTNANPQRFVVAGLTVLVDDQTVYANVANFAALTVGMRVEVHGLRDAGGVLRATRIEATSAGADELRGPISSLDTNANTFTINGNVMVNYTNAIFSPAGSSENDLTAGAIVEVRGSIAGSVFTATQIDIEAREDAIFAGNPGEKQEVEGFVRDFAGTTFQVGGGTVRLTSSTRFEGGSAADLANDVRVEVEGTIDAAGVLVAVKVEFKQVRLILHGLATRVQLAPPLVVVLGQPVLVTGLTRIDTRTGGGGNSNSLADIAPNVDCVEIRGFAAGPIFIADEIKEPSSCGKHLVQAPVTTKNTTNSELTFFGDLVARLDGASVQFRDVNDAPISRDAFFAAVAAAQPGVPVRWSRSRASSPAACSRPWKPNWKTERRVRRFAATPAGGRFVSTGRLCCARVQARGSIPAMAQQTVHFRIEGVVQGVGFRDSLCDVAQRLRVDGWVRNRSDGSIEAVVRGTPAACESLLAWARRGPPAARVDRIDTRPATQEEEALVAPGFRRLPTL